MIMRVLIVMNLDNLAVAFNKKTPSAHAEGTKNHRMAAHARMGISAEQLNKTLEQYGSI
jgi:hypothetical protein